MEHELIEKLIAYFKTKPNIIAVYLFGSYAKGKEHHSSDIDFLKGKCILVRDPKKLAHYKMTAFSRIVDFAYYKNQMQTGLVRNIMGDI